jgi:AraC family transcriptional regulator, positive regulator of tynA and feaB
MPDKMLNAESKKLQSVATFNKRSTNCVRQEDRFDFWRHLFFGSFIDRPDAPNAQTFDGTLVACVGADGTVFANLRADPIVCSFGQRDSDLVLLGCVTNGSFQVRHGHDGATVFDASRGLIIFDCDRPATALASRYDLSYLAVPRAVVAAAMGRDPIPHGEVALFLPDRGLPAVLLAHLRAMAVHGTALNESERSVAMQAASALAMTLLSSLGGRPDEVDEAIDASRYQAAKRYMARNIGRQDLTAHQIAAAVGCSRAYLYRLFAARDETVVGHLRDIRMGRARGLLRTRPKDPIGMIALQCGYTDLSAFGKAFRHKFGMSPQDCREAASDFAMAVDMPAKR